jgi:hypothetical protein
MKTVRDFLRDADPLRHESDRSDAEGDRLRHAIVAAASDVATPSSPWFRTPAALLATVALIVVCLVAVGSQIWSRGGATLQAAAIRFEIRLAEDHASAGLHEVRIAGSDRAVYLHQEIIVTNEDIAQSRVVQGNSPSRFGVSVEFNASGAQKMRQATADHVGRPVAILIDGEVVATPVVRSPISTSGVISGDFTQAEAERIVNGIRIR